MLRIFQRLLSSRQGILESGCGCSAIDLMSDQDWRDGYEDYLRADLVPVYNYLRGCIGLEIPDEWYPVLPKGFL